MSPALTPRTARRDHPSPDVHARLQVLHVLDLPPEARLYAAQLGEGDVLAGLRRALLRAQAGGALGSVPTAAASAQVAGSDARLALVRALHLPNAARAFAAQLGRGDVLAGVRAAVLHAHAADVQAEQLAAATPQAVAPLRRWA